MSTILDLQNITTTVNEGTNEEKQILKNINFRKKVFFDFKNNIS